MPRSLYAIAGLIVGVVVDILVNILAAGIQQQVFPNNMLSTQALWILAGLIVLGLVMGYWLGGKVTLQSTSSSPQAHSQSTSPASPESITITRFRALLSYSKLKGQGIHLSDILLIGSRLDIERER